MSDKFKFSEEERERIVDELGQLSAAKNGLNLGTKSVLDRIEAIIQDREANRTQKIGYIPSDDANKLRTLADWFDKYDADMGFIGMDEVQTSLREIADRIEHLEQGIANWVRVSNERQYRINELESEITASACYAPSSIGEVEIENEYTSNMALLDELSSKDIFEYGVEWAISRLSERKIVLPSEINGFDYCSLSECVNSFESGYDLAISEIKRLNGIN